LLLDPTFRMTGFLDLDIDWCSEENVVETGCFRPQVKRPCSSGSVSNERYVLFRIYQAMDKVQECNSHKHTYRITQ
jgi:hypothetical protein